MDALARKEPPEPRHVDLYRRAEEALAQACSLPPLELSREVDVAERAVAELRDSLIDKIRNGDNSEARTLRIALDRVNTALSLIAGVEYPAAGIHRNMIEQARELLKDAETRGLLLPGSP